MSESYTGDPDFIITLEGKNIPSEDVLQWTVVDDEEHASSINVELENDDYRYSGAVSIGAKLNIRFGYQNSLVGKAELPVFGFKENYALSQRTVNITAKDPTQKGGGNKFSGSLNTKKVKDAIQAVADSRLKGTEVGGKPPENIKNERDKPAEFLMLNETIEEFLVRAGPYLSPEQYDEVYAQSGKEAKSVAPKEDAKIQGFKGKEHDGAAQSGVARKSDNNLGSHQGGKAGQDPIKATLKLIGYPELKAKSNISIENVGPTCSGTYYVKQCRHTYSRGGKYETTGSLIRGGSGKGNSGPVNGYSPVVDYVNIYDGNKGYIGPRKYDQSAQDTLTFGDGGPIESLEVTVAPQKNRGGMKGRGTTKGHDLANRVKSIDDTRLAPKDRQMLEAEAAGTR